MTLPDRLERIGIVVGSSILLSLPVNLLLMAFLESDQVWPAGLLGLGLGAVVGVLVATNRLAVTYRQIWSVSVLAWLGTLVLWWALDVGMPAQRQALAVMTWLLATGFAALATARRRAIAAVYRRS